jgi:hypothetical protein
LQFFIYLYHGGQGEGFNCPPDNKLPVVCNAAQENFCAENSKKMSRFKGEKATDNTPIF